MFRSPWATVTKYHRLNGLNSRLYLFTLVSGGLDVQGPGAGMVGSQPSPGLHPFASLSVLLWQREKGGGF